MTGTRAIEHGDLTGKIAERMRRDKVDWWSGVRTTVNALNAGEPAVIVEVQGVSYAVPRDVYLRIIEIGAGQ